ncbi:hypothetical protein GLOIN_2v1590969 [Rhizophagus clarus]|uniref:Uncharacterized protein n=1 Tax=Rhizophagus clarus TaxID=94130 RepID=A0A8H3LRL2_9GLOM|nr:hypothetical protein GLOIN_2v1590969 [Rhizophagus clarus]
MILNELRIMIEALNNVVIHVEEPSFKLADFSNDIGSYFGISGIIDFLFGSNKADSFGILEEEEKDVNGVTETNNNGNEAAKYYVVMDFYEHAIKV